MGVRGWRQSKIARTCCDCCDVGESAGKMCTLRGEGCSTGLFKLGVHGMGQQSAVKEGWCWPESVQKLVSRCGRNV